MNRSEPAESEAMRKIARALAANWIPGVEPQFIRTFSNHVYALPSSAGRLYLRITPASRRSEEELKSELEFVRFLAGRGLPVSEPVPSRAGRLVHTDEGDGERSHACVFLEAPGVEFAGRHPSERRPILRLAGRTIARLHHEGRGFERSAGFRRLPWSEDRWSRFAEHVPRGEREAWRLHEELQAWTSGLPRDPAHFGLIHGDLTILNLRILPERITLFDFDSCCEHWYAYEIATFLHYFGAQEEASRRQAYDDVLDGYASATHLDSETLAAIPLFGKMRLLYSFLVFAETWGFRDLLPEQQRYFAVRRRLFTQAPTWPAGR